MRVQNNNSSYLNVLLKHYNVMTVVDMGKEMEIVNYSIYILYALIVVMT